MTEKPRTRVIPGTLTGEGINNQTGEVIDLFAEVDIAITAPQGRRHQKKQRSHKMFALTDPHYIRQLELSGLEFRVLFNVMGNVNPVDNLSRVTAREIAEELGSTQQSVSRALQVLTSRKILFRSGRSARMVSPWLSYSGNVHDWENETDLYPKPVWSK